MKKILNEELSKIKSMMGLLNEQSSQQLISDNGYRAILTFENAKGTPNNDLTGATSMGYNINKVKSLEGIIANHIDTTISLERWFKINDLFRTQIYSFMFNADSKNTDKFKWLAGLAQSIDNTIQRPDIIGKQLNDPYVQSAIKLINKTIDSGKINGYYGRYTQVLNEQYKTISNPTQSDEWNQAAQKYSWSVRVQEIESNYNKSNNKQQTTTTVGGNGNPVNKSTPVNKPTQTTSTGQKKLVIRTADLTSFMEAIKTGTAGKTFDLKKSTTDVDGFIANLVEDPNGTKIIKMVLAVSLSGQNCESCKSILAKNNAQVVDKGTFEDGKRIYNLIAIIS
jgi:hypothetical protein